MLTFDHLAPLMDVFEAHRGQTVPSQPIWQAGISWLGTFLTSAGAAGLAALAAAIIGARMVATRLRGDYRIAALAARNATTLAEASRAADRDADIAADARARWWEMLQWLWASRIDLEDDAIVTALKALEPLAQTSQQKAMLVAVTDSLLNGG